jgi:type II secretory pathway component GspD/PulD (secretin)
MKFKLLCSVIPFILLLIPGAGTPQNVSLSSDDLDLHRLVEFNFIDSDIAKVIHHVVRLTGWSVFYDSARVQGKVTIVTPGKIPLAQALRLVQGVTRRHGHAIQVLPPDSLQPLPLMTALAELSHPPARRNVIVWRNSDARGPQSRADTCDQYNSAYPLPPFWVDVMVDPRR